MLRISSAQANATQLDCPDSPLNSARTVNEELLSRASSVSTADRAAALRKALHDLKVADATESASTSFDLERFDHRLAALHSARPCLDRPHRRELPLSAPAFTDAAALRAAHGGPIRVG